MKSKMKRIIQICLVLIVLLIGGSYMYVSQYSHADANALALLDTTVITQDDVIELTKKDQTVGFIFYPGGKVEAASYLPMLTQLHNEGVAIFMPEMPFNLAVLNPNAAEKIMAAHPEIKTWYIGGHSLGGAMASDYYAKHTTDFAGLVLLGSYIYGDISAQEPLIMYGSEDHVLDRSKITGGPNVHVIAGGNHAGFGNYGIQKGDGQSSITATEQQALTVREIMKYIKR